MDEMTDLTVLVAGLGAVEGAGVPSALRVWGRFKTVLHGTPVAKEIQFPSKAHILACRQEKQRRAGAAAAT